MNHKWLIILKIIMLWPPIKFRNRFKRFLVILHLLNNLYNKLIDIKLIINGICSTQVKVSLIVLKRYIIIINRSNCILNHLENNYNNKILQMDLCFGQKDIMDFLVFHNHFWTFSPKSVLKKLFFIIVYLILEKIN